MATACKTAANQEFPALPYSWISTRMACWDGGEPDEITDGSGAYDFTGLAAGNYIAQVDATTVGSDLTRTTPAMVSVALATSEDYNDADFGYSPTTPLFSKDFAPGTIDSGQISTLTFLIDNSGSTSYDATSVGFTDTLPAGVVVANPANVVNTCGGTVTAVAGFRQHFAKRRLHRQRWELHPFSGRYQHHSWHPRQHDRRPDLLTG